MTLQFASRAKKIKQHATITEVIDERTLLENYREEIEELKNQLKEAREVQETVSASAGGGLTNSSIDDDDVEVLTQAVGNLERLILKTSSADEKKRKKKRKDAMEKLRSEQGIPKTISGDSGSVSGGGNTLLNSMLNGGEDEATLLYNSLSIDDFSRSNRSKMGSSSGFMRGDDHSLESGSIGDDSTVVEGKKLVIELHRIQGLLATVLAKKGSPGTPGTPTGMRSPTTPSIHSRSSQNEGEVERLRAQLHDQAVHSSLRMADSTFLQAQLQEKDALLKDISQILEAVEQRQLQLETENERLKQEWANSVADLRSKESESLILEKLMKKRGNEIKKLKAQLGE